jgi:hypothetical protein
MKLEEIKQYEIIEEKIKERAYNICDYIISNDKSRDIRGSIDKFEIYDDKIIVTLYETWAYGGYDYHDISIEMEIFTSDNWLELITEKVTKSNEAFLKNKEEKEERERLYKIEQAEKTLKELKKESVTIKLKEE